MYKCESLDLKLHKPSMNGLRGTCVCVLSVSSDESFHPNYIQILEPLLNLGLLY